MIKIGLVGWGMSAETFHLPFIIEHELLALVGVVTSRPDAFRASYLTTETFNNIDALISGAQPDVVVLATPNHLHYSQAMQVLKSGCHVLIDKPFVTSVEEANHLISLSRDVQKRIFVYHNRRWDGDFLSLKAALAAGEIGRAKIAHINFDRFRPEPRVRWRESAINGAGIWFDLGPHLVDQALQLFGRPQFVQARLASVRQGSENTDYAHVVLIYDELDVVLRASPFTSEPMLRFQIETDKGTWRKYGLDPQEEALKQNVGFADDGRLLNLANECSHWSTLDGQIQHPLQKGFYMAFYQAVVETLTQGAEFPVTMQQAMDVTVVIEAATKSENLQSRYNIVWNDLQRF